MAGHRCQHANPIPVLHQDSYKFWILVCQLQLLVSHSSNEPCEFAGDGNGLRLQSILERKTMKNPNELVVNKWTHRLMMSWRGALLELSKCHDEKERKILMLKTGQRHEKIDNGRVRLEKA